MSFYVGETLIYAVSQEGYKGKSLSFFAQEHPNSPIRESLRWIIQRDASISKTALITLEEPGIFHAYWTLDGAKIGEHLIEVKPRPDYTVKR